MILFKTSKFASASRTRRAVLAAAQNAFLSFTGSKLEIIVFVLLLKIAVSVSTPSAPYIGIAPTHKPRFKTRLALGVNAEYAPMHRSMIPPRSISLISAVTSRPRFFRLKKSSIAPTPRVLAFFDRCSVCFIAKIPVTFYIPARQKAAAYEFKCLSLTLFCSVVFFLVRVAFV